MHPTTAFLALSILAANVNAHAGQHARHNHNDIHLHAGVARKVAADQEITTVITTTTALPTTIDTNIGVNGVHTIIPDVLTMTFNHAPEYLYMETIVEKQVLVTKTTKVTGLAATSSSNKASTSSAPIVVSSTKKATSSTTKGKASSTSAAAVAACSPGGYEYPGCTDGFSCMSDGSCVGGCCYKFIEDPQNCGSLGHVCDTATPGVTCYAGSCVNTQTDPNNCGTGGSSCAYNGDTFACNKGTCVDLSTDNQNCGTLGTICKTGTGCYNGKCIDTTSDPKHCSDVGYACPSTLPKCVKSVCVKA